MFCRGPCLRGSDHYALAVAASCLISVSLSLSRFAINNARKVEAKQTDVCAYVAFELKKKIMFAACDTIVNRETKELQVRVYRL